MDWQAEHRARVSELPEAIRQAHTHSIKHRQELLASAVCGCFYCQAIYSPAEITAWTDEGKDGQGQTALCPRCGIDSVLGDRSGVPITDAFLVEMRRYWF